MSQSHTARPALAPTLGQARAPLVPSGAKAVNTSSRGLRATPRSAGEVRAGSVGSCPKSINTRGYRHVRRPPVLWARCPDPPGTPHNTPPCQSRDNRAPSLLPDLLQDSGINTDTHLPTLQRDAAEGRRGLPTGQWDVNQTFYVRANGNPDPYCLATPFLKGWYLLKGGRPGAGGYEVKCEARVCESASDKLCLEETELHCIRVSVPELQAIRDPEHRPLVHHVPGGPRMRALPQARSQQRSERRHPNRSPPGRIHPGPAGQPVSSLLKNPGLPAT